MKKKIHNGSMKEQKKMIATKEEIDQVITLLRVLIERMIQKNEERLEELTTLIKNTHGLQHLFYADDPRSNFDCALYEATDNFNHLQKCINMTSKFKFLEEYIDLYLNKHPETINHKNGKGYTALMMATMNATSLSTKNTVKILLKHHADVNLTDNDGLSALMLAFKYDDTKMSGQSVKLLLEHGSNVNLIDKFGRTVLNYALEKFVTPSKMKLIEKIIERTDNCDIKVCPSTLIQRLMCHRFPDETIRLAYTKGAKLPTD